MSYIGNYIQSYLLDGIMAAFEDLQLSVNDYEELFSQDTDSNKTSVIESLARINLTSVIHNKMHDENDGFKKNYDDKTIQDYDE